MNSKVITAIAIIAGIASATLIMMLVMNQQNTIQSAGTELNKIAYECKIRLELQGHTPSEYAVNACVRSILN